jgi:hypothetical protein
LFRRHPRLLSNTFLFASGWSPATHWISTQLLVTKVFCTIITSSHLGYAEALAKSLHAHGDDYLLYVLVVDSDSRDRSRPGFKVLSLPEVDCELSGLLARRYLDSGKHNEFRWSMKSVLLLHLLGREKAGKVIFVDPDIAFFKDPRFLFDLLDSSNVLLTPHWRCNDPSKDPANFRLLMTEGHFNAGFVAVSSGAEEALEWWARICLGRCERARSEGLFVDQSYLNLFPVYFDKVRIMRHRGCNVANWNLEMNRRELSDGKVKINGNDPVVFIHFTNSTIRGILRGEDGHLRPHLVQWLEWRGVGLESVAHLAAAPAAGTGSKVRRSLVHRAKKRLFRLAAHLAEDIKPWMKSSPKQTPPH